MNKLGYGILQNILWITLLVIMVPSQAAVIASLDRQRIAEAETVRLLIEADRQLSNQPDTTPLERDFEILGVSTGSQINIINGRVRANTTWTITLSPKRTGQLTIPSLSINGERTLPLKLEVATTSAANSTSHKGADVFIESEIDSTSPYVQGMVRYTLRIYYAVQLTEARLSELAPENTLVRSLGEDRKYSMVRDGRPYQVLERRYLLFPQTSGDLTIDSPILDTKIPDRSRSHRGSSDPFGHIPFFGRDPFNRLPTRPLRVRGESHRLTVLPRPSTAQGTHWLPAQNLELVEQWQPADGPIHVGDPLTRTLTIRAQGLIAEQLPTFTWPEQENLKAYPDKPQGETRELGDSVMGESIQSIAFVPSQAGVLTLPPVRIHWWDTEVDQERIAELPARQVEILPTLGQQSQDPWANQNPSLSLQSPPRSEGSSADTLPLNPRAADQAPSDSPGIIGSANPWPWVSLGLGLLWVSTLGLWWRNRGPRKNHQNLTTASPESTDGGKQAKQKFRLACQGGDPMVARRALLNWAAAHWPDSPPRGLDELAARMDDPEIRNLLTDLDRVLYRGSGAPWDGKPLAERLRRLPKPGIDGRRGNQGEGREQWPLPELYP